MAKLPTATIDSPEVTVARSTEFSQFETDDAFLYHTTTKANLDKITKGGKIDVGTAARSNFADDARLVENSKGRVFFSERSSVWEWSHEIGDNREALYTIKVPKSALKDIKPDPDATTGLFVSRPVPINVKNATESAKQSLAPVASVSTKLEARADDLWELTKTAVAYDLEEIEKRVARITAGLTKDDLIEVGQMLNYDFPRSLPKRELISRLGRAPKVITMDWTRSTAGFGDFRPRPPASSFTVGKRPERKIFPKPKKAATPKPKPKPKPKAKKPKAPPKPPVVVDDQLALAYSDLIEEARELKIGTIDKRIDDMLAGRTKDQLNALLVSRGFSKQPTKAKAIDRLRNTPRVLAGDRARESF